MYLPLEQGLRHRLCEAIPVLSFSQSVSTARTRIKTCNFILPYTSYFPVKVYLPLEQGLRPERGFNMKQIIDVKVYLPLEQGLRQDN